MAVKIPRKGMGRKSLEGNFSVPSGGGAPKSRGPAPESYTIHSKSQGGKQVGKAKTKKGARRSVDKRDNAYGGYDHYFLDSKGKRGL